MPFPFTLPTTSHISFADYFSSSTHPSLIIAATTSRGVLRDVLKKYKRMPPQSQAAGLSQVLDALTGYLPYLFAVDDGLAGSPVAGAEVQITPTKELEVEWRPTLTATTPGREPPRVKLKNWESEFSFVLSTLAKTHALLARKSLHALYDAESPSSEQRAAAIRNAGQHYSTAHSIHNYLVTRRNQHPTSGSSPPPKVFDIGIPAFSALASLDLAEATLLAPAKDDPYPAVVADERNKNNKDWMFKAPSIPKVRTHLFARVCLAAADHAANGHGVVQGVGGADDSFLRYLDDLKRTARGKACRFLALDADMAGNTGEAIAWLRAARKELGFAASGEDEDKKLGKLSRLKKDWAEKREDRRIEKGLGWGADAGRFEEARVLDMLEKKWVKMNDTMDVQVIPPSEPLLSKLPSGREFVATVSFQPPCLSQDELALKRAPPDPSDRGFEGNEDDSSDDDATRVEVAGAFPTEGGQHSSSSFYY